MVPWPHAASLAALLAASTLSINAAAFYVRDSGSSDGLLVDTSSGKVQGFYNDTAHDVRAFLGVPFAAAPTGKLRFMPPAKRSRSKATIQATFWPATCPGYYPNDTSIFSLLPYMPFTKQDEDCLSMNVWAPSSARIKKNGDKLLPVLVYIYGGGFGQGATSVSIHEGTDLVANHDVSLVIAFITCYVPCYRPSIELTPAYIHRWCSSRSTIASQYLETLTLHSSHPRAAHST
jgi:hypothetical protein